MREIDALQKQQNRKNFACQGAGKLTGLGVLLRNSQCCSASLAHARPTIFYIPPSIIGASAASPTLVVKTENCLYLSIYLSIYICMVRAYSVYTFCPICARCNISTLCRVLQLSNSAEILMRVASGREQEAASENTFYFADYQMLRTVTLIAPSAGGD